MIEFGWLDYIFKWCGEMDIIQAIIIGIVQGLTEFLPVGSSAHLIFAQNTLGVESSLAFDVFLHLGSLIAVLWFFRADIIRMIQAFLCKYWRYYSTQI